MTDIWDEIEEEVFAIQTKSSIEEELPSSPTDATMSAAEEKRQASIAARAMERAEMDAERAKRKKLLEDEKQKNKPIIVSRPVTEQSPYDKFVAEFVETRRQELMKKNGRGFICGIDKNRNPTKGADYERAVQDAIYSWRNRKI